MKIVKILQDGKNARTFGKIILNVQKNKFTI